MPDLPFVPRQEFMSCAFRGKSHSSALSSSKGNVPSPGSLQTSPCDTRPHHSRLHSSRVVDESSSTFCIILHVIRTLPCSRLVSLAAMCSSPQGSLGGRLHTPCGGVSATTGPLDSHDKCLRDVRRLCRHISPSPCHNQAGTGQTHLTKGRAEEGRRGDCERSHPWPTSRRPTRRHPPPSAGRELHGNAFSEG